MKTLTKLVVTALSLITLQLNAQNGTQVIKLTLTSNSNLPSQAPAILTLMFDANGNDSLAFPDQGNSSTLGSLGSNMYPFTLSADSTEITTIDSRPELLSYRTIPFGVVSKLAGDFKIIAQVSSTDSATPVPAFVWLEQLSTNEHHSILDTTKFTIPANTSYQADFVLHIGTAAFSTSTDETCYGYNNGTIFVQGPNVNNFTYELSQGAGIIYSGIVAGTDTTFSDLSAGNYVGVIRVNGIPVDSVDITINSGTALIADFATDYNFVNQGDVVNFTDNSTGAFVYEWNFGDGDSSTTSGSESHIFLHPGLFNVSLTIRDMAGCAASTYDLVNVDSVFVPSANNNFNGHPNNNQNFNPIEENTPAEPVLAAFDGNREQSFFSNDRIVVVTDPASVIRVTIISINGSVISSGAQTEARAEYPVPANGVYIVTTEYTNGTAKTITILAQ